MRLVYRIALRNLLLHKGRSIAIGLVIFTGTFFMTMGNGTITSMEKGLEANIVKGTVGDITLLSAERKEDNLNASQEPVQLIEKYQEIYEVISGENEIDSILPTVWGRAAMLDISLGYDQRNDFDLIGFAGVDIDQYKKVSGDNIRILEGESLRTGERGILINKTLRDRIYATHRMWILPENGPIVKENLTTEALAEYDNLRTRKDLVLMGVEGNTSASDVRVSVKGIFEYRKINDMLSDLNLIDIETARECMGFLTTGDMEVDISREDQDLLQSVDEDPDRLFSENVMFDDTLETEEAYDYETMLKSSHSEREKADYDNGIYTKVQINLKPNANLEAAVNRLNSAFQEASLDSYVRAVSWKQAWPVFSTFAKIFRYALRIFVNVVYFAAILMIANILSIAAVERTDEIGTMRTLGAQKGFASGMFMAETSLISLLFGVLGILSGGIAIIIFDAIKIKAKSDFIQFLIGGDAFCPVLDINGIVMGMIQLAIITVIAMGYPALVARRITPMDAIKRN